MPMIAIDTDQAEATANAFNSAHSTFSATLQALVGSVQALGAAWEGAAQVQFLAAWEEWQQGFVQTVESILPMMEGVRREKQELEEADGTSAFN